MNIERPLATYHVHVCGKHFEEILGHGDLSSLFTYIPTRNAIIMVIIFILAFIGLIIVANYYPRKSWLVFLSLIFLIYYSVIAVKEIFYDKDFRLQYISYMKQLDDAKTLDFEITNEGLKYSMKELNFDATWDEIKVIANQENCICFRKVNDEALFLLKTSFESQDFESIRKIFQEKVF